MPDTSKPIPFEGAVDMDGIFRDLDGRPLELVPEEFSTDEAKRSVKARAHVSYEGCGCGGGYGCQPSWMSEEDLSALRSGPAPRKVRTYGAPTWFDVWSNTEVTVVFVHGDVEWGNAI